jgi:CheY-like chemotaxis protein
MPALDGWKILTIDDDPDSLRLTHDLLTYHGAWVYTARSAETFHQLWSSMLPRVVLMDLAMPSPNGWDLLATIRQSAQLRGTPVIAVTAYHSAYVHDAALRAGFADTIAKPLRSATLVAALLRIAGDK